MFMLNVVFSLFLEVKDLKYRNTAVCYTITVWTVAYVVKPFICLKVAEDILWTRCVIHITQMLMWTNAGLVYCIYTTMKAATPVTAERYTLSELKIRLYIFCINRKFHARIWVHPTKCESARFLPIIVFFQPVF